MEKIEYLKYDDNVDHLTIYKANEKIVKSIDAGYAILSLNEKKEIVGLEFMGINKKLGISLDILQNIVGCEVHITYNPSEKMLVINVLIKSKELEKLPFVYTSNLKLGNTPLEQFMASSSA
ncbi:hypothetical protein JXB41_03080 [Candidatus Woesearchaeota archaeon]|nr:hypothetical protein [Candidatus Woesearchaeota archaeon]